MVQRADTTFDLVHRSLDGVGRWARRLRFAMWIFIGASSLVGVAWMGSFLVLSEGWTRIIGILLSILVFGIAVAVLCFTAWSLGGVMQLPDFVANALRTHAATAQELVHDVHAQPKSRNAVRASIAALQATRDVKDVTLTVRRVLPVASGFTFIISAIALAVVFWGAVLLPVVVVSLGVT